VIFPVPFRWQGASNLEKGKMMAEIKSTLDLVLERTKNLTFTDEERESLQRKELEGRIRGWVKKYLEGLMDLKAVRAGMDEVPRNQRKTGRDILQSLILENLDVQGGAGKSLDLLEGILAESREPYLTALQHYERTLAAERLKMISSAKAKLAERGISGGAVSPNLEREEAWRRFREKARGEFREGLNAMGRHR
jgi:uncharacterized protein (UPF0147 family)